MKKARVAAIAIGAMVVGVLALEAAIHWPDWRLSSDRGLPTQPGHPPLWHHGLIHGTKADDVIYGTELGERIEALKGQDRIIARGGDDVLNGGADDDVLMGGPGNDTYVVQHHSGGADVILEESGTDTLQLVGGRVALASVEILRHGDDLLIRWNHDQPGDAVLIRSWFAGALYHVERLQLPDGTLVALEPLAERAKEATSEDVVHFTPLPAPRSD